MEQAPMWFRVDMDQVPDGYDYEFEKYVWSTYLMYVY
jgi:hypothetical protein